MKRFNKILAVIISVLLIIPVVPLQAEESTVPSLTLNSAYNVTGYAEVTFTPTETAFYQVYTLSTNTVDTVINVYAADDTHLGSDECSGEYGNATLILPLSAGVTYKICVDSRYSSEAVYELYVKKDSDINAIDASLSTPYIVNIDTEGKKVYYKFVPEESNAYKLYASNYSEHYDTYGILYDSSFMPIIENDDKDGVNFGINYPLNAGETYYICTHLLHEYQTGQFVFRIDVATPPEEINIISTDNTDVFYEGEIGNFECEIVPEDAHGGITWSIVGDQSTAKVGGVDDLANTCQIEFISAGTTTIKATAYNGVSDTYTIEVLDVPVNPISLETEITVDPTVTGGNAYFSFTPSESGHFVFASSGANATRVEIYEYSQLDEEYIGIGGSGSNYKDEFNFKTYLYLQEGIEYLLRVKSNSDNTFKVAIAPEINATDIKICCNSSFNGDVFQKKYFYAETVPFYAVEDTESDVYWESSNENVVDIWRWDGEADFEGIGTSDITATLDDTDLTDTITVTVTGGESITVGETYPTTISEEEGLVVYNFTPETTGKYKFYSVGDYDTNATLYDANFNEIDYSDEEEGSNFGINIELTAGNTYYYAIGMFNWEGVSTFDVKLEQALSITEMNILTPPDRTEYIEGYFEDFFSITGVRLEIKWSDNSIDFWSYQTQEEVNGERVYFSAVEENGTGYISFTCAGFEKKYYVTINENTIESIELIKPTEDVYIENSGGTMVPGMNGEYYYYNANMPRDAKIKINYSDKPSVEAYVGDYVDGYIISWDSNQMNDPWQLGENDTYIYYLDNSVRMGVNVVNSPVSSIEITNNFEITIMENGNGSEYSSFRYDYYAFLKDAEIKVNLVAGGTEYISFDKWGEKEVSFSDDQDFTPWIKGGENYITVEYMGRTTTIPVNIVDNTVDRVEVSGLPELNITFGDIDFGYVYDGVYYVYLPESILNQMSFTVYFTDRPSVTYNYTDDDDYGTYDGYYLYRDECGVETPGNYNIEFTLMGYTFKVPVTINDSLAEGIEIVELPNKLEFVEFPDVEGLKVKLTYDGGNTKTITATNTNTSYVLDNMLGGVVAVIEDGDFKVFVTYDYELEKFVAAYEVVSAEINGLSEDDRVMTDIEFDVINPDIDDSKITVTFENTSTKQLTLELLGTKDWGVALEGVVRTELGIHYCYIETVTEEDKVAKYFYIFDKYERIDAVAGDVDGDGKVNTTDLAKLKLYLAGASSNIDFNGADMDGKDGVNTTDLALLKLYLAGA